MPRKVADKGEGKGKGKPGIAQLSWGRQAPWGLPLGEVQALHDHFQSDDVSQWLFPICAVTLTPTDHWSTVTKGIKLTKVWTRENDKFMHATKFEALANDEPDHFEFPDIDS